jgi:hypothetical protein
VKINPNGKQLVVYRVTTLLFPGKQPIACLSMVGKVNNIYQKTEWDQGLTNLGFEIKEVSFNLTKILVY